MAGPSVTQSRSRAAHGPDTGCCPACSLKSDDWDRYFKNMDPFHHPPLDTSTGSIRLLDLLPSQHDGIVRCKLKLARLPSLRDKGSHISYQAVSYTWGRRYAHKWILVNDQRYLVRENLWRLLRELASSDVANGGTLNNLWIDAVCIDQVNIVEKNQQVQLMRYIFSRADYVIVWPGVSLKIAEVLYSLRDDAVAIRPNGSECITYLSSSASGGRTAIETACNEPYWSRLWILQEVGVARRIVLLFGQRTMDWEHWMIILERFLKVSKRSTKERGSRLPGANVSFWRPGLAGPQSLHDLMIRFRDLQCADHRDRIYGLLGLVEDGNTFEVDYNESPGQLLRRTIRHFCPPDVLKFAFELRCALDISGRMPETELVELQCLPQSAVITVHPVYANFLVSLLPNCHRPPPSERRSCWRTSLFQETGHIAICRCLECQGEPFLRDIQHAFSPGFCTSFVLVELLDIDFPCYLLFRRIRTISRKHTFEIVAAALVTGCHDDFVFSAGGPVLIRCDQRLYEAQAQLSWCEGNEGGLGELSTSRFSLSTIFRQLLAHRIIQQARLWSRSGGVLHSNDKRLEICKTAKKTGTQQSSG